MNGNFYAAEYSYRQNAFHVETVAEMISRNQYIAQHKYGTDFIPFAICETEEQATEAIGKMKNLMRGKN